MLTSTLNKKRSKVAKLKSCSDKEWVSGKIATHDQKESGFYIRLSARKNHPKAIFFYGWMLFLGKGVTWNLEKADKYLKRAAKLGAAGTIT